MSPLKYLFQQLNVGVKEFSNLSQEDQTWYKNAAREEMAAFDASIWVQSSRMLLLK